MISYKGFPLVANQMLQYVASIGSFRYVADLHELAQNWRTFGLPMTSAVPFVVLAEDDPDDRDYFRAGMKRLYPEVAVSMFENGDDLLGYLESCALWDLPGLIMLDYKMAPRNAPEILISIGFGTRYGHIPSIVWSTSKREKDVEECLNFGALRFVVKPDTESQLNQLLESFRCWIGDPVSL